MAMCSGSLRNLLNSVGVIKALKAGRFNGDRKFEIEVDVLRQILSEHPISKPVTDEDRAAVEG